MSHVSKIINWRMQWNDATIHALFYEKSKQTKKHCLRQEFRIKKFPSTYAFKISIWRALSLVEGIRSWFSVFWNREGAETEYRDVTLTSLGSTKHF